MAPFWDPPGLKKQGFRVEGVAFFEKSKGFEKIAEIGAILSEGSLDFQIAGGRWVGAGGRGFRGVYLR